VGAVVEGNVEPELSPGVEEPPAVGVLPDDASEVIRGNSVLAVGEERPARAEVVGSEDIGFEVVGAIAISGSPTPPRAKLLLLHRPRHELLDRLVDLGHAQAVLRAQTAARLPFARNYDHVGDTGA